MIGQKVQGYTIIESTVIGNAKFVVGENSGNSIAPYVTWQANMKNDPNSYFWGHYYGDKMAALADYGDRISQEAQYLKGFQAQKSKEKPVIQPER
ncbi:MAG: hypothetical protein PHU30_06275 [Oscillospiraceae bacterium]|nr:hypothetical protein [Oscillospiraceae bacterium]